MPSYKVKRIIHNACLQCAGAAIPGTFYPIADIGLVGASWVYMMTEIADEHDITLDDEPMKMIGSIAAGIGGYVAGSKFFSYGITAILTIFTGPLVLIAIPVINMILNIYFTWTVGRAMDKIFSDPDNSRATTEVAKLIAKTVCHLPSRSEFGEFWNEMGDYLKDTFNF